MKQIYTCKAFVPTTQDAGNALIEAWEAKKELPELGIGKSAVFGMHWIVSMTEGYPSVARIAEIRNGKGEVQDIPEFVAKANSDYAVTLKDVQGRNILLEIVHEVDDSSVLDGRSGAEISSALKKIVDRKIHEGIVTKDDAYERIEYMRHHGASEKLIIRVVSDWMKHERMPVKPDPLYVDMFLDDAKKQKKDGVIVRCLKHLSLGYSLIVKSPRGLGKLVLSLTLAWLRGQGTYSEIFSIDTTMEVKDGQLTTDNSVSEWLDSNEAKTVALSAMEGDIESKVTLDLKKAQASSVHLLRSKSNLCKCMLDQGLFLVDEINLGDANIVEAIFNPLLDGHKKLNFPGIGEIQAKRPFAVIATMNEGYEGTQQQNKAMESRFKHIVLEYPKTLRKVIEAAALAELRANGYENATVRKDLLDQAEQLYNKLFRASTTALSGTTAAISDSALNVRGFASAIVICMIYDDSSLAQYLLDDVVNGAEISERPILKNMVSDTVTI